MLMLTTARLNFETAERREVLRERSLQLKIEFNINRTAISGIMILLPILASLATIFIFAVFASIYHSRPKISTQNIDRDSRARRRRTVTGEHANEEPETFRASSNSSEEDESIVLMLHRTMKTSTSLNCGESFLPQSAGAETQDYQIPDDSAGTSSSFDEEATEDEWLTDSEEVTDAESFSEETSCTTIARLEGVSCNEIFVAAETWQEDLDEDNQECGNNTQNKSGTVAKKECQQPSCENSGKTFTWTNQDGGCDEVNAGRTQTENYEQSDRTRGVTPQAVRIQKEPTYFAFTAHA